MAEPTTPESAPATPVVTRPVAWHFFTPRGIAAFAPNKLAQLFLFQILVAVLSGCAVVWFLYAVWFPSTREAIRNLAGEGTIRAGTLELPGFGLQRLVTNRFLTYAIDVDSDRQHSFSADIFVVLRKSRVEICSLFGCVHRPYPPGQIPFTRLEMEARWGAWEPFLLGIAGTATALAVLASWWLLATLYFLFARALAFFRDRELTLGGSWRLCGAALLAGAILFLLAIAGYGLGIVDLPMLCLLAALHVIAPWVLIVFAVLALPPVRPKGSANPFQSAPAVSALPSEEKSSADLPKT
jgi:hypothetical protein